jgi:hypothetical protein
MRTNGLIFALFGTFSIVCDVIYWFASKDPTGTACLGISSGLGFMIAGYLIFTDRRIGAMAQDRPDAEISDGAGEIGNFVPASWWPILIALSVAVLLVGLIFAMWLALIGALGLITSVSGLIFENLLTEDPRPQAVSSFSSHH